MATDVERLKKVNGFWFPATDTECSGAVFNELGKLEHLPPEGQRGVAVQAGGNVGVFPHRMSEMFQEVYTFEPDPINFECMEMNLKMLGNVHAFCAALSDREGMCSMHVPEAEGIENCGAFQIKEGEGDIPVMMIDELELTQCDLIYLDIEGFEDLALIGAQYTIDEHRPVIVCENKGLNERFPAPITAPSQEFRVWLCERFGYRLYSRLMRDDVFVCCK